MLCRIVQLTHYEIVTTRSGVGYASVTSITHSRRVVTILFHDGCRSARLLRPTVRLVTCCLCRVKGHLQASQPLVSAICAPCPPVALVG